MKNTYTVTNNFRSTTTDEKTAAVTKNIETLINNKIDKPVTA